MAKARPFTSTQNLSSKPLKHGGADKMPKDVPAVRDKRDAKGIGGPDAKPRAVKARGGNESKLS
jgi:hypothetical protein